MNIQTKTICSKCGVDADVQHCIGEPLETVYVDTNGVSHDNYERAVAFSS